MTPERYQRINALADAALELPAEKRAAFLDEACAGDAELRAQIVELLAAQAGNDPLLDVPLLDVLAQDIAGTRPADLAGTRIHHYDVISRLGSGGIGEVWLARDVHLARDVALKLLSPVYAADPWHTRRFQQEARAASTLNHPNIVTIYEIGSADGVDFIAQELVSGNTVRLLLSGGRLPVSMVVDIGAQVAAALAAAHGAGIVHRDIKPENVMVRPDGLVKVLDFGLARFLERPSTVAAGESKNVSATRPGIVLGTVKYMSPEQARGLTVDARSDIFSLGVVLYEMLAGAAPFAGDTTSDVLAAILSQDAAPLSRVLPDTPPALEAIVAKCLCKTPADRYASAHNLRLDLERLLRRLEAPNQRTPSSNELLLARDARTQRLTAAVAPRQFTWRGATAIAIAVLLLVTALMVYRLRKPDSGAPFANMGMTALIIPGEVTSGAISGDGAWVAYLLNEGRGQSIWIRQLGTSRDTRIVDAEDGRHSGLAFVSGGAYLVYRRSMANGQFALYRVAVTGGAFARLKTNLGSAVAFSPDGARYAYLQIDPARRESRLMVAAVDGSGERTIDVRRRPRYFSRYALAWSPDGRYLACMAGNAESFTPDAFHLTTIRVADGQEREFRAHSWAAVNALAWPAQGGRLYFVASEGREDDFQIWSVSPDNGAALRVTNDLTNYAGLSVTSDGRTMLATEAVSSYELWVAPGGEAGRAAQVTSGGVRSFNGLAWAPDGHIVYSALAGRYQNIWTMDASGGDLRQLTTGPDNKYEVAVTPDGRYVVYHSHGAIWRMDRDGSHQQRLTWGRDDVHPEPSAEGKSVYYASFRDWAPGMGGHPTLMRVSIDGGQPTVISDIAASIPRVSPDGRLIACEYFPDLDPQFSADYAAVLNADGGEPTRVFDKLPSGRSSVSWAPEGDALEFATTGVPGNLWRVPLSGGPAQPVTSFRDNQIFGYAWSRDGKKLALCRGGTTRDLVLIHGSGE
ncbi:MAG TPA: protein kinase [Bryobacteraceae bacterium]|nr:protein kinase [Bryobacteraceae bacterium]